MAVDSDAKITMVDKLRAWESLAEQQEEAIVKRAGQEEGEHRIETSSDVIRKKTTRARRADEAD